MEIIKGTVKKEVKCINVYIGREREREREQIKKKKKKKTSLPI